MAYYRLMDPETKQTFEIKRLDAEAARVLNGQRDDGLLWRRGLDRTGQQPTGTLTKVLRTLSAETFNEHSMNVIQRWLNKEAGQQQKARLEFHRLHRRFSDAMATQPEAFRKLVGSFIGKQNGYAFEAGLRLGMAGHYLDHLGTADDAEDFERESVRTDESMAATAARIARRDAETDPEDDHHVGWADDHCTSNGEFYGILAWAFEDGSYLLWRRGVDTWIPRNATERQHARLIAQQASSELPRED